MKNIIAYSFLVSLLLFTSCDSWLDVEPKGKIILTSADEYGQLFDNTSYISYDLSDVNYLEDETWVNGQVLVNGWTSLNLVVANVLYREDYDRSENAAGNAGSSTTFYQYMYQRITKVANTIIYNASDMEGTAEEISELTAQAKAYRAFSYFLLINLYAKPYDSATASTDGGVAIRTDAYVENEPGKAKSTVAEVYQQIEQDLSEAIPNLPEEAETPYRFNKAAGYALQAKVHLFKKEYDECIAAAEAAYELNHSTYDLPSRINASSHVPSPAIYATGEENLFFATTSTTYFLLHPEMVELYEEGLSEYGQPDDVEDVRLWLYRQPGSSVKDYQYTMQYIPSRTQYANNSVGFRTTEVMLMLAECYARKGMNDKVKEYLEPYLTSRYANYDHSLLSLPSSITETVKFVLKERRKELTMGCNRFMDLRRLNTETEYQVTPTRTIPLDTSVVTIPQGTYTLSVNSPLYVLPFPAKVLANDTRLTSNYMNE